MQDSSGAQRILHDPPWNGARGYHSPVQGSLTLPFWPCGWLGPTGPGGCKDPQRPAGSVAWTQNLKCQGWSAQDPSLGLGAPHPLDPDVSLPAAPPTEEDRLAPAEQKEHCFRESRSPTPMQKDGDLE